MAEKTEIVEQDTGSGPTILDAIVGADVDVLDAVDVPIIVISRDCIITRINRAATTGTWLEGHGRRSYC